MRTALGDITNQPSPISSAPHNTQQTELVADMPTMILLTSVGPRYAGPITSPRTVRFAGEETPPATESQGSTHDSDDSPPPLEDVSDKSSVDYLSSASFTRDLTHALDTATKDDTTTELEDRETTEEKGSHPDSTPDEEESRPDLLLTPDIRRFVLFPIVQEQVRILYLPFKLMLIQDRLSYGRCTREQKRASGPQRTSTSPTT